MSLGSVLTRGIAAVALLAGWIVEGSPTAQAATPTVTAPAPRVGTVAQGDLPEAVPLQTWEGTPFTVEKKGFRFGLFSRFRYGITESTEISTSGAISTLVSPQVMVKQKLYEGSGFGVALAGSVNVPTPAVKLLQTGIVPCCFPGDAQTPFAAVLGVQALVGYRSPAGITAALSVQGRFGLAAGDWTLTPSDVYWLDPALAPLNEGPAVGALRFVLDVAPKDPAGVQYWSLTWDTKAQIGGFGPDLSSRLIYHYSVGRNVALGIGGAIAYERMAYGWGWQPFPLADVAFRL